MAKQTQNFRLFTLLKSSTTVSKEVIAKELGVKVNSVPVYIHELKKLHKAEIETVRKGREVIAYKLVNRDVKVPEYRKNAADSAVKKPVKVITTPSDGSVAVPDADLEVTQIGEREFADIRSSLGVDFGRGQGSDY